MKKNILILGITGQNGTYLSKFLDSKKYKIIGISRKKNNNKFLKSQKNILIKKFDYSDYKKLEKTIVDYKINQIYFFSGQNKPSLSNELLLETLYTNIIPVFNIINIILNKNKNIRFFNSSSCEIFAPSNKSLKETSKKEPNSIYALSKLISFEIVKFFREKFDLKICSGIMFHHESVLRNNNFVLKKIINSARKIKRKKQKKLHLGDINVMRDWGWAPEYVEIIYKLLNKKIVDDYVIATGKTVKLKKLINQIFKYFNLNWQEHVQFKKNLKRQFDAKVRKANNSKIIKDLSWRPKYYVEDIVANLLENKL